MTGESAMTLCGCAIIKDIICLRRASARSAEALRNALYKFSTYLRTYLLGRKSRHGSFHLRMHCTSEWQVKLYNPSFTRAIRYPSPMTTIMIAINCLQNYSVDLFIYFYLFINKSKTAQRPLTSK